ncbi:MAG: hypothetical protein AAFQ41_14230, partial [Cyanobacteria bacterium J06623_7]
FDNLALIDASGTGGGDININGKNIKILNGSAIISNTLENIDGGTIQIQASNLLEINGSDIFNTKIDPILAQFEIFLPFASQISSNTFGTGKGGDIKITAQSLKLVDGGTIELLTVPGSTGDAGDIFIVVEDSIELNGVRPLLGVGENSEELIINGISLDTAIDLNQASEISTASIGEGNAGSINIITEDIRLLDGATIAATPFFIGEGGSINIDAERSVEIIGASPRTGSSSSSITANTFAEGNAGSIDINTNKLVVRDGALLISTTANEGDAGNINIRTLTAEIDGFRASDGVSSLISAEAMGSGDGGDIFLNSDRLVISDRASISVRAAGQSVPGNLIVNAETIELSGFASITAETESGSGGNIELNVRDNLILRDNSLISAQAFNSANGGNLSIDANFVVAFPEENNDILANAEFGNGGNITVTAEGILGLLERPSQPPNQTNDIDASSEFGQAGTVELQFPQGNTDNPLSRLDSDYADAAELFENTFCKIRANSRFIATGRGGIPRVPDRLLLPEHTWTDWRMVDTEEQGGENRVSNATDIAKNPTEQIRMIQGWAVDSSGNVVLTDRPLKMAARAPGLKHPNCNDVRGQQNHTP